jgi:hypothetical protein
MDRLQCGRVIQPDPAVVERRARAKSWESCVFRCECGAGFSDTRNPAERRMIMLIPEDNLPEEVRTACREF